MPVQTEPTRTFDIGTPPPTAGRASTRAPGFFRTPLIILIFASVLLVPGCSLLDSGGGGDTPDPKVQGGGSDGGTFTTTWHYLDVLGGFLLPVGIGMAIARTWLPLFPRGVGVMVAVSGLLLMLLTDILAAHEWIVWVVLLVVLPGLAIVEVVGREKVKRKVGRWLKSLELETG